VTAELFHPDGWMDGQRERQIERQKWQLYNRLEKFCESA